MKAMSATTRYVRQSSRKVRLVADVIRGLGVNAALMQLAHIMKAARMPVEKTLRSAIANAENTSHKNRSNLFVKEICVDEGAALRRWRPRAFGRAAPIRKHSCHIVIRLSERDGVGERGSEERGSSFARENRTEIGAFPLTADEKQPAGSEQQHKEIIDNARQGRHETAQRANVKDKKSKGFMKKIIQRKTG